MKAYSLLGPFGHPSPLLFVERKDSPQDDGYLLPLRADQYSVPAVVQYAIVSVRRRDDGGRQDAAASYLNQ